LVVKNELIFMIVEKEFKLKIGPDLDVFKVNKPFSE